MSEKEIKQTEKDSFPVVFRRIRDEFQEAILDFSDEMGELTVTVQKGTAYELLEFLKTETDFSYDFLVDVTAVDYSLMEDVLMKHDYARFMVVYHLYSYKTGDRVRVKTPVSEKELSVCSVTSLWKSAGWLECEVYDMFGIIFENHPNLRRILMPDDFEGHPLCKDYPLRGRGERETFDFERQNA